MIKNYMEQVVDEVFPDFLNEYPSKNQDFCMCEKCITDMKCISLNHLKPAYFSTDLGNVYLKIEKLKQQYLVDILSELTKAAIMVSENKRHDSTDI